MAVLFTEGFTFADDTTLPSVGISMVYPAGLGAAATHAKVVDNRGQAGTNSGLERIYRVNKYPGYTNYAARISGFWANPFTQGRSMGLGVRVDAEGNGYYLQVSSGPTGALIDKTHVRLRRRYNGNWSNVDGDWKDITATVSSFTLKLGVDIELHVENIASGVKLVGRMNGNDVYDVTDTHAQSIDGGGTVGIWLGPHCLRDEIEFDDITVSDFEEEAPPDIDTSSGLILMVDGRYMNEQAWTAAGIVPLTAQRTFDVSPAGTLRDLRKFNDPALYVGAEVAIKQDGIYLTSGMLRQAVHKLEPSEGTEYEIVSWKELAQEIPIFDQETSAGTIIFNPTYENTGEDEAIDIDDIEEPKSVGEMIAVIIDTHADGDGGLRALGAAPGQGSILSQPLTTLMPAKPMNVSVSGNVLSAVETLLGYYPEFGLDVDPDSRIWRIIRRSASPYAQLDLGAEHIIGELRENARLNYTAVLIRGQRPEETDSILDFLEGSLNPKQAWLGNLGNHKPTDARENKNNGKITGNGTDGSRVYIDTDITMDAGEWAKARAVIHKPSPAQGVYRIYSNTGGGRLVLDRESFIGDLPITNVDTVSVANDPGHNGGDNSHAESFRVFEMAEDLGIANGVCATAKITTGGPDGGTMEYTTKLDFRIPTDGGAPNISLDVPAVRPLDMVTTPGIESGGYCDTPGMMQMADNVQVEAPTYDPSDPQVPTMREPENGYRGTAYSFNASRWNGGGEPQHGDAKVRRILTIDDSNFTGEQDEPEYRALAQSILAVLGELARQGQFSIQGKIDTEFASLDHRLQIKRTGGRTTGWEDATDIWHFGTTFDLVNKTTTLWAGTLASAGRFDIGRQRQLYAEKSQSAFLRAQVDLFRQMMECLQEQRGGNPVAPQSPQPVCSDQVAAPEGSRGRSVGSTIDCEDGFGPCAAEKGCVPQDDSTQECGPPTCNTMGGWANANANADDLAALDGIVHPFPEDYDPTTWTTLEVTCWLVEHVAALWRDSFGALAALDLELKKTQTDLGNVRGALDQIVACVNSNFTTLCDAHDTQDVRIDCVISGVNAALAAIAACFATKYDGDGSECELEDIECAASACEPTGCGHSFTETVCEDPCLELVTKVASTPPDAFS